MIEKFTREKYKPKNININNIKIKKNFNLNKISIEIKIPITLFLEFARNVKYKIRKDKIMKQIFKNTFLLNSLEIKIEKGQIAESHRPAQF